MKRVKFPILLKVILAGLLVSFVASAVAIVVSYNNQISTSKKTMINNIDHTLDDLAFYYEEDEAKDTYIGNLESVKAHMKSYYDERKSTGKEKKLEDFDTFEEYETYYKDADNWVYPKQGEIGLSQDMLVFRANYREIANSLLDAELSSGTVASYLAYKDVDNSLVFISDSRMYKHQSEGNVDFYHLPGSYYQLKDSDIISGTTDKYSGYYIYGRTTRVYTVYSDAAKTDEIAIFFIEYNDNAIIAESQNILRSEITILSLTTGAMVLIYAILSYFLFVKNINKLSKASTDISNKLASKSFTTPTEIKIRSHDEMTNLATSLNYLQQAVYDYVNIIEREASERQKINAELEVASRIQLEALPPFNYDDSNISLRASIKAAKEVGGDFYDYFYLDESRFAVVIADVSGKGIPASLFMMRSKAQLKNDILSSDSLEEAIYKANNRLVNNNNENLFVTAFIGIVDLKKKELRFVNCGHEKPYIISKNKVTKIEGTSNFVLGEIGDFEYKEEKVKFEKGDTLFMFTDGLNESINSEFEEFGYQRIVDTLSNNKDKNLDGLISSIGKELSTFVGDNEAFDDITMIALSCSDHTLSLTFNKKDYSIITEATDEFNENYAFLPIKVKSEVGIVIDEFLNNLVSYETREDLEIRLEFSIKDDELIIEVISNGEDYNPFEKHKDKYLNSGDADISVGGFGIKIVKDLMDAYSYEYKDNHSIVKLTKKIN